MISNKSRNCKSEKALAGQQWDVLTEVWSRDVPLTHHVTV